MGKTAWAMLSFVAFLGMLWIGSRQAPPQPAVQFTPPTTQSAPAVTTQAALELPYVIRDSGLIIEKMVCYEGDFWEDGSDDHAVDIMALVICNPGTEGVRSAEISVRQGHRQLCFVITYLPPGSRVLVLERLRNGYSSEPLTECRCVTLDRSWKPADTVLVEPAGIRDLTVRNTTQRDLQAMTLCYKRYSPEAELYLGGISYYLTIEPLGSGKSLQIRPSRYVEGAYQIVLVETQ